MRVCDICKEKLNLIDGDHIYNVPKIIWYDKILDGEVIEEHSYGMIDSKKIEVCDRCAAQIANRIKDLFDN